ncbi:unnamed protein product, partial [Staurois parvus]
MLIGLCEIYIVYKLCNSSSNSRTEQYKAACFHGKTQHSTQGNPLIVHMLTPFCPVSLVQYQCFLLALITVLVSLGGKGHTFQLGAALHDS